MTEKTVSFQHKNRLHVTNGDCAAELIEQTNLSGEILAWRDMLHEGAVTANLSLPELRTLRAHFIADSIYWANYDEVFNYFTQRDETLRALSRIRRDYSLVRTRPL
jgi:hypothetical protein